MCDNIPLSVNKYFPTVGSNERTGQARPGQVLTVNNNEWQEDRNTAGLHQPDLWLI